tara:strand:+ start:239 stop:853 length:615 start_codon:yes stop_codon:yes gene_type:complete
MKLSVTKSDDLTIKNNLRMWIGEAMENPNLWNSGIDWYSEAQSFCENVSQDYFMSAYDVAVITAILSPNNKWERNKIDAITVIKAHKIGLTSDKVKVCTYNANKIKAFDYLNGLVDLVRKSPKTHSFAMNVGLLSAEHITIDKWHLRACVCTPTDGVVDAVESCTMAQYRRIEMLTSSVAQEYHLKGYEIQAIIWVMIKKTWNR